MPLGFDRRLEMRSAGFGIEAEVTGKILLAGIRLYEVPISYPARHREDRRKLTWRDGVAAPWILERVRRGGDVVPQDLQARVQEDIGQIAAAARVVVVDHEHLFSRVEKAPHEVRADEARSAGDQGTGCGAQ
jgi:hypothetical protein